MTVPGTFHALARTLMPALALAAFAACSRDPVSPPAAFSPVAAPRGTVTLAVGDGSIAHVRGTWGEVIHVMEPDGSGVTALTSTFPDTPVNSSLPEISPDGSKIVFQRATWYPVVGETTDIYVMNVDGTGVTNLTNTPDYQDAEPTWSPDGSKIAFKSNRDGSSYNIYTMNGDGSGVTKITSTLAGGFQSREPSWSPDATQIAYTTDTSEAAWLLCIVTISGGGTSCTTDVRNRFGDQVNGLDGSRVSGFFNPDWGPDGRIAVTVYHGECSGCNRYDMFLIDSDFTDLTPLTLGNGQTFWYPSWSPDGAQIAFMENTGSATTGIGVMSADGSGRTIIAAGGHTQPDWGPDVNGEPSPQCSDGIDNDDDSFVDYPADPGCTSAADDTESPNPPPPAEKTCKEQMMDAYARIREHPGLAQRTALLQSARLLFEHLVKPASNGEVRRLVGSPAWKGLVFAIEQVLGPEDRLVRGLHAIGAACGPRTRG